MAVEETPAQGPPLTPPAPAEHRKLTHKPITHAPYGRTLASTILRIVPGNNSVSDDDLTTTAVSGRAREAMDLTEFVGSVMLSEQQARPVQRRLIVDLARTYDMDVESVTSMLYTLLWEVVLHPTPRPRRRWVGADYRDSDLSYSLKKIFAVKPWPSAQTEALLVGHGDPVQYHLLLLDPNYGGSLVSSTIPKDLARVKLQE